MSVGSSMLRGVARAAALAAWTALVAVALCCSALLQPLARGTCARLRARIFRAWARGAARIVGLAIDVAGDAPRAPFFLVANHLGYLDVVVLAATVDATFVAKSDVARWPLIGPLCRAVGTVFVDRTRKRDLLRVLPILEERLAAGGAVVVFPEGTTSDGARVLPFRSSLFAAAVRRDLPAHVAVLTYLTPAAAPHPAQAVCWWGDMPFLPHLVRLLRLPRCTARLTFVRRPIVARDRKTLARAAHAEIVRRFVPVSRGESPCHPVPALPAPTSTRFAREPLC